MPSLYAHYRLHRTVDLAPGTLTNLTRTADVIIGLLLLMLSHGLRRRKRRAWQAVILLLASSMVFHSRALSAYLVRAVVTAACWPLLSSTGGVLRGRRPAHPLAGAVGPAGWRWPTSPSA